jgi:multiple sugar transport system ATP-binding protein
VRIGTAVLPVPALREEAGGKTLLFGVRPEHVHLSPASALRAEVLGSEYLGINQIVTCRTAQGATLRAKVGVEVPAQRGDQVGLAFDASQVSLFDQATGRALRTTRHDTGTAARAAHPSASLGAAHG